MQIKEQEGRKTCETRTSEATFVLNNCLTDDEIAWHNSSSFALLLRSPLVHFLIFFSQHFHLHLISKAIRDTATFSGLSATRKYKFSPQFVRPFVCFTDLILMKRASTVITDLKIFSTFRYIANVKLFGKTSGAKNHFTS